MTDLGKRLKQVTKERNWLLRVRERSCFLKRKHKTRETAQKHADSLQRKFWSKGKIPWKPYKCHFGSHWHVGRNLHPPKHK